MPESDAQDLAALIRQIRNGEEVWFERQHKASQAHKHTLYIARVDHLRTRFHRWARRNHLPTENFAPQYWGWRIGSILPERSLPEQTAQHISKPGGKVWVTPRGRLVAENELDGVEELSSSGAVDIESMFTTIAAHVHSFPHPWR